MHWVIKSKSAADSHSSSPSCWSWGKAERQTWIWFLLSPWNLFQVKSYQWPKNWCRSGYPARRLVLKGQHWDWLAWCQYTVTGWNRMFDLQLLRQCVSMYNRLSRSVHEIHYHVAGRLSHQQTTTSHSQLLQFAPCSHVRLHCVSVYRG